MSLSKCGTAGTFGGLGSAQEPTPRKNCHQPRTAPTDRGAVYYFINNYQDDPIETQISWRGQPLFGGNPIYLPARQGAILPLDWQVAEGVTLHYATAEVRGVERRPATLTLRLAQDTFMAELSLSGWGCPGAQPVPGAGPNRWMLRAKDGQIVLYRR